MTELDDELQISNIGRGRITVKCADGDVAVIEPGDSAVFEYDSKTGRFASVIERPRPYSS